nr:vegetative cell wall protein gp1-like [Meriones unguiculatus]
MPAAPRHLPGKAQSRGWGRARVLAGPEDPPARASPVPGLHAPPRRPPRSPRSRRRRRRPQRRPQLEEKEKFPPNDSQGDDPQVGPYPHVPSSRRPHGLAGPRFAKKGSAINGYPPASAPITQANEFSQVVWDRSPAALNPKLRSLTRPTKPFQRDPMPPAPPRHTPARPRSRIPKSLPHRTPQALQPGGTPPPTPPSSLAPRPRAPGPPRPKSPRAPAPPPPGTAPPPGRLG